MSLQESGEMYLETIHVLLSKGGSVRSIDVCEYMGYSKPSVSRAVAKLKNGGYITIDNSGYISLTESGRHIAEQTYERHQILTKCFVLLGVDEETAVQDACRIEHDISEKTFEIIKKHVTDLSGKKE